MGGNDQVSSLKQFVQFGLDKQMAVGGTLLRSKASAQCRTARGSDGGPWNGVGSARRAARRGIQCFHEEDHGPFRHARNWFGYASVQTLAAIANQEKTLDAVPLARALSGFKLPPEIALQPGAPAFRAGDHELMSTVLSARCIHRRAIRTICSRCAIPCPAKKPPDPSRNRLQDTMAGLTARDMTPGASPHEVTCTFPFR